jgi:hypothetical protein
MADTLSARSGELNKTALAKLSQALGLNWAPQSMLFDAALRQVIRPRIGCIFDWMHCLVGPGLASVETGYFMAVLRSHNITLQALDEFGSQLRGLKGSDVGVVPPPSGRVVNCQAGRVLGWPGFGEGRTPPPTSNHRIANHFPPDPKSICGSANSQLQRNIGFPSGRLPKNFFQNRYSVKDESLKAFASEMMTIVAVIRFFIELVLAPSRLLEQHCRCFLDIASIVDIASMGDKALRYIDKLTVIISRHHRLFLELYGEDMAYPKFHYVLHMPEVLRNQQSNFSCFVVERKHRVGKSIANHIFGNYERSLVQIAPRFFLTCQVSNPYHRTSNFTRDRLSHFGAVGGRLEPSGSVRGSPGPPNGPRRAPN